MKPSTSFASLDLAQLSTVNGGLFGPFDVILGPLQQQAERESACKSLQAAKVEARNHPGDKQSQQWVEYKRQFCPFNPLKPSTW